MSLPYISYSPAQGPRVLGSHDPDRSFSSVPWRGQRGKSRVKPVPAPRVPSVCPGQRPTRLVGDGSYSLEVVGWSLYRESFATLFSQKFTDGFELKMRGEIHFERNNSCRTYTAAVFFRGYRIGRLSQQEVQDLLLACRFATSSLEPLAAQLLVKGGQGRRDAIEAVYSVRIDAAKPYVFV